MFQPKQKTKNILFKQLYLLFYSVIYNVQTTKPQYGVLGNYWNSGWRKHVE